MRFVFYAVLEGLFEDGVQEEVTERIISMRPAPPPQDPKHKLPDLFVYGCPICLPSLDAFRTYALGPEILQWQKARRPHRGFGNGLSREMVERFMSGNRDTRLRALEELTTRYLQRRFESARMTEEEKTQMRGLLERSRKQVMENIARNPRDPIYQGFDECPSCEGATWWLPEGR